MLAKKTSKNQLTLPKEVAVALARIREKIKKLGVTGDDVANAVRWARCLR